MENTHTVGPLALCDTILLLLYTFCVSVCVRTVLDFLLIVLSCLQILDKFSQFKNLLNQIK